MKKKYDPQEGELVVCRITRINPNSAFAELVEYERTGMIHVSEVAARWVRDIREFIKENQYVVCRVIGVDRDHVSLSIKRVRQEEASSRINEFKRENKAEKLLEMVAKSIEKTPEQAFQEVGFRLQDQFGSLSKAFEIAWKNPELLKSKGIPNEWIQPIVEIVKKNYSEKTYELKAELNLMCYASDGIEIIRDALSKAVKENGIEVKYISAPKYMIIAKGKNYKEIEAKISGVAESITREINKCKGDCTFKMVEE
ncbi:MAG: S1 RNA-binding domain-containing protein [Candidatus Aenigmarchaeota archaeon]|nr:S1 RNA-binding domain-containing protein [Candidatus Aenigmarchaeota archaeon]